VEIYQIQTNDGWPDPSNKKLAQPESTIFDPGPSLYKTVLNELKLSEIAFEIDTSRALEAEKCLEIPKAL